MAEIIKETQEANEVQEADVQIQEVQEPTTKVKTTKDSSKKSKDTKANMLTFRPVKADEIDCRVNSINSYLTTILLYKDARVDQNILDETVGPMNWQKSYSRENQNCTVSIWDEKKKQWIAKEDTGTESNTEKEKGLASDSFKRACFCWGIGRELYTTPLIQIPTQYIETKTKNDKLTTYEKFVVMDMDIDVDKSGAKKITKLTLGVERKEGIDWIWSYKEGCGIRTHMPKFDAQKNVTVEQNVPAQNVPTQTSAPRQATAPVQTATKATTATAEKKNITSAWAKFAQPKKSVKAQGIEQG